MIKKILESKKKEKEMERKKDIVKKAAIGSAIGTAVGALAGVLLAPKSGKDTRNDIANKSKECVEATKEKADKVKEKACEVKNQGVSKIVDNKEKLINIIHKIKTKKEASEIINEAEDLTEDRPYDTTFDMFMDEHEDIELVVIEEEIPKKKKKNTKKKETK